MPSIISGFEYDIFISYRHNDNLDGWVTDFVQNLQKELSGTLKDSLTIYFDKSPHDGLLETHNVDKSLEGKLKCLVFIPIISQTYCDPKSFAWPHEFCAFNKHSKDDQFGRDIRLSNGNVASRILPVNIHDLDAEDKLLIQSELGGPLRAIGFIYTEAGVNRPLLPVDNAEKNLNRTSYRNQINKVAHAIKEIIAGLKSSHEPEKKHIGQAHPSTPAPKKRGAAKLVLGGLIALIALTGLYYYVYHARPSDEAKDTDKSVAVLAFSDLSPGKDQEWFSDGLTEEILNALTNLNELKVTARTSSFYFKGKNVSLKEIARQLGVAHVVEGSVQKINNQLRITAQLIRADDEFHIWSKTYDRTSEDLFQVQSDIAENIARALLKELTPEGKVKLVSNKPTNVEAYEYYLRGVLTHADKYWASYDIKYFEEAQRYFLKAISLDPGYAETYGALADLYDTRSNIKADRLKFWSLRDSVMRLGYRLNPNSVHTLIVYGLSFQKRPEPNLDSSFYYLKRAYRISPDDALTNASAGDFYIDMGMNELAKKLYVKARALDPLFGPSASRLGFIQFMLGNYRETKIVCKKALELDNGQLGPHLFLGYLSALGRDYDDAAAHIESIAKINPNSMSLVSLKNILLASKGQKMEALKSGKNDLLVVSLLGMKKEFLKLLDSASQVVNPNLDPEFLQNNAACDFVKDDPQFKIILARVQESYADRLKRFGNLD